MSRTATVKRGGKRPVVKARARKPAPKKASTWSKPDLVLLVPALKGADAALRDKFLACLSQRAAQTIEDEMADRGPMPLAEVQEAQRAVVAVARRLADEGTLSIGSKDEEYV